MPDDHGNSTGRMVPQTPASPANPANAMLAIPADIRQQFERLPPSATTLLVSAEDPQERGELVNFWASFKGLHSLPVDCRQTPGNIACHLDAPTDNLLVLENIEDLPLAGQTELNSFLTRSPQPTRPVVVATAASTAPDRGRFDPALWGLLARHRIDLPPLRARPDDIKRFAREALARIRAQSYFGAALLELLALLSWPRHKAELVETVEFLASRTSAMEITVNCVASHLMRGGCPLSGGAGAVPEGGWERIDHILSLTHDNVDLVSHLTKLPRPLIHRRIHHHRTSRERTMRA